jgi:chaperonin GroEL
VLIKGGANEMLLAKRIKQLGEQVQAAENPFEKESLNHRLARLFGGVAVLRVGGKSEPEMLEKKSRAEDAIHCCRGALQEGLVPGGGLALLKASADYMESIDADPSSVNYITSGRAILALALTEPCAQILRNAGHQNPEQFLASMLGAMADGRPNHGYNSAAKKYGDMYEMGIVDPAKVVITALTKAASIGALLLTTEVLCCDIPEETKPEPVRADFRG